MKSAKMPVTPEVMQWCRKKAGYSIEAAANKIKRPPEDIEKWEDGTLSPTLAQLRKASEVYRFPTAVFFLPEPPRDFSPLRDFRALPHGLSLDFSPELSLSIRETQARQEWVREYLVEEGEEELGFIGSANIQTNPKIMAKAIRNRLSMTIEEHKASPTREDALRLWTVKAEETGIFIFQHRKISLNEARGFVLCDKYAPFVFLNANDAKAGRLFTLIHELVHLWINESGISNLELYDKARRQAPEATIERYCNVVASEVLVDSDSFNASLTRLASNLQMRDKIEALSKEYKVSEEVIARKLLEAGMIKDSLYSDLRSEYQERWKSFEKHKKKKPGPVSPYRLKLFNIGYAFTRTALAAYSSGSISGRDTSLLLGVKVNNLSKLSEHANPFSSVGR